MSQELKIEISVFVKTATIPQWVHGILIPAPYEHLLYTHYYPTVPAYKNKGINHGYAIEPDPYLFETVPTEEQVIAALLQSQRQLAELMGEVSGKWDLAMAREGLRCSQQQLDKYVEDAKRFRLARLEEVPSFKAGEYHMRRVASNRFSLLAQWLLDTYGEYDLETGDTHLEVKGYVSSYRYTRPLSAMALARNEQRLVVCFSVNPEPPVRGNRSHRTVCQRIEAKPYKQTLFNEPLLILEKREEDSKQLWICTGFRAAEAYDVANWMHPELEYEYPGINQKAFEIASLPADQVIDLAEQYGL